MARDIENGGYRSSGKSFTLKAIVHPYAVLSYGKGKIYYHTRISNLRYGLHKTSLSEKDFFDKSLVHEGGPYIDHDFHEIEFV